MSATSVRVQTVVAAGTASRRWQEAVEAAAAQARSRGAVDSLSVAVAVLDPAVGLAGTHNRMLAGGHEDLVVLVDATAVVSPWLITELVAPLVHPEIAIVEARQLPVEQAGYHHPLTGDTSWASAGGLAVRSEVLVALGGFDAGSFPHAGFDVDLSWRARLAGWRVVHQPSARVFLDRRVSADGRLVIDAGDMADQAEAALVLAWKYSRPSLVEEGLAQLSVSEGGGGRAAAAFGARRRAGSLPTPVDGGARVAEFDGLAPGRSGWAYQTCVAPAGRPGSAGAGSGEPPSASGEPFLSVLVRTQGRRLETLHDTLLSLSAQTCPDFEVVVLGHDLDGDSRARIAGLVETFPPSFARRVKVVGVEGGGRARPLNVGAGAARGRYLSALDDDDVALAHWVEGFAQVAAAGPGLLARNLAVLQSVEPAGWGDGSGCRAVGGLSVHHPARFDLWDHLVDNRTPICSVAIPRRAWAELGLAYDETLPVLEDWDLLLRAAMALGVADGGAVTAVYRIWQSGARSTTDHTQADWDRARQAVVDKLDTSRLPAPAGWASRFRALSVLLQEGSQATAALRAEAAELEAREADLQARVAQLEARVAEMEAGTVPRQASTAQRLTAPLRLAGRVLRGLRDGRDGPAPSG